jgi:hypothetical protein
MKKPIASLMVFVFLIGCSSTTIKSNPSGAKLYVNGQYKCETPCTYSDTAAMNSSKTILLKKKGHKDTTGQIKRDTVEMGHLIAGIFFLIPLIWCLGYEPEYTFEMERLESKLDNLTIVPQVTAPEKPITSAPITPSSSITKLVTWTFANIRSGAGNEFPVVATAKRGDKLTVVGELGEWFNVRLEDGKEGWINSRVVK